MAIQKRKRMWLYQCRRVATQGNAGGQALVVDVVFPTGSSALLISGQMTNAGNNHSATVDILDEDNVMTSRLGVVASAAGVTLNVPPQYSPATTASNGATLFSSGVLIGPGQKLSFYQSEAGAQNDTLTADVVALLSSPCEPTWSVARGAGTPTLAASSISAANTIQAVYV